MATPIIFKVPNSKGLPIGNDTLAIELSRHGNAVDFANYRALKSPVFTLPVKELEAIFER